MSGVVQQAQTAAARPVRLDVLAVVLDAWRFLLAHPGSALRTGWIPLALLLWVSLVGDEAAASRAVEEAVFRQVAIGAGILVVLILGLVAWQRILLFGPDRRRGLSPLRVGRAEILSMLHFPLVGVLFVPLQVWPLVAWLASTPAPFGGGLAAWMPWIAFAAIVFPGGPYLVRATLMLPAIAAAGGKRMSIAETANRVWDAGGGNTIRLFLTVMLAGLPIAFAGRALEGVDGTGWSSASTIGLGLLRGTLLLVYVFVVGGALARAWSDLCGMDSRSRLPQSGR